MRIVAISDAQNVKANDKEHQRHGAAYLHLPCIQSLRGSVQSRQAVWLG